jgi:hypothetical protein
MAVVKKSRVPETSHSNPYEISLANLDRFSEELGIDKNDLDTAYERQPDTYFRVADEAARSVSWVDGAKMEYENTKARVDGRIRQELAGVGGKSTETQIASQVSLDDEVQTAFRFYLSWKELATRWDALEKAFRQRSTAIDGLGRLYGASYFVKSGMSIGQNVNREREHKDVRREVGEATTSRSRP